MFTCKNCGKKQNARLARCPDNKPGCLVAHFDKHSWVCRDCGTDNRPDWSRSRFRSEEDC